MIQLASPFKPADKITPDIVAVGPSVSSSSWLVLVVDASSWEQLWQLDHPVPTQGCNAPLDPSKPPGNRLQ